MSFQLSPYDTRHTFEMLKPGCLFIYADKLFLKVIDNIDTSDNCIDMVTFCFRCLKADQHVTKIPQMTITYSPPE